MQIWQMESYPCGDRRMPHHLFPPKMLTPDQLMAQAGVTYYRVDLDDSGVTKKRLSKVKNDCDMVASDILTMDENLIEFEQKLEAMYEPTEREESTVAMVLEGGIYYDVEFEEDKWVRIHMERGDLIVIPKDTPFRSTTTSKIFAAMQPWLEYESGQSWCESSYSKYQTIPFVAEFANTVTNLPIIILPLLNVRCLRRYISEVNSVIILPHLLLTLNGLASTYYHATLNLFGQLVDELSILWLINICVVAYLPTMKFYPGRYKQHINGIRWAIVLLTTLISALCFLKPSLNAFALMTVSLPAFVVIYYEGIRVGFPAAEKATYGVFILWALATVFWFADRIFCDLWLYLGTPYLHAIFHLLSSAAGYNLFIMLSLLDIKRRSHEHNFSADIHYFPFRSGKYLSLAYISLREKEVFRDVQE